MITENAYPILEFDTNRTAKIEPTYVSKIPNIPQSCVITFFREVIENMLKAGELTDICKFHSETVALPVYTTTYLGE